MWVIVCYSSSSRLLLLLYIFHFSFIPFLISCRVALVLFISTSLLLLLILWKCIRYLQFIHIDLYLSLMLISIRFDYKCMRLNAEWLQRKSPHSKRTRGPSFGARGRCVYDNYKFHVHTSFLIDSRENAFEI